LNKREHVVRWPSPPHRFVAAVEETEREWLSWPFAWPIQDECERAVFVVIEDAKHV
jgi:hypothetical protein